MFTFANPNRRPKKDMLKKKIKRSYRISKYIIYKETLVNRTEQFWAFIGSFAGIGLIAYIQQFHLQTADNVLLIGSFGASSVLIYGAIQSPLAQPRNLIGGHVISALIGVSIQQVLPDQLWLSAPLAVSLSIIAMQYTKTLHPPGGATALIAVSGSEQIIKLGYLYILWPVLTGVFILLSCALLFNNITPKRTYPTTGRFSKSVKWIISPARGTLKRLRSKD